MKSRIRHFKVREYAIALKQYRKGEYRPIATRTTYAHSMREASKKFKVSPTVMRKYGIVVKRR